MQPREIKKCRAPLCATTKEEMLQLPRYREYRITFSSPRHRSRLREKKKEKKKKEKEKEINTPEREQKNKPLKRLMNFKSASH